MIESASLSATGPQLSSTSMWVRKIPLFLSVATIVGVGFVTAAYAGDSASQSATEDEQAQSEQVPPATAQTAPAKPQLDPITAVTFADNIGTTYIFARDVAKILNDPVEMTPDGKSLTIGEKKVEKFRRLYGGDALIPVRDIVQFDGTLYADPITRELTVTLPQGEFIVTVGKKRIEVDKATQELTAFQGDIVVMKTNISTGRPGHNTPNGEFETGPVKERMHYSRKYDNAPMPYSIQVNGDIFFHGYSSVPSYPASHGCIRIPLGRKNPARYLYGWAETGIETKIFGSFSWETRRRKGRRG